MLLKATVSTLPQLTSRHSHPIMQLKLPDSGKDSERGKSHSVSLKLISLVFWAHNDGKNKSCPTTRHAGTKGERKYSSYLFTTLTLNGVSGQCHALAVLYPRDRTRRYPVYRRLGGPQSWSGHRGQRKTATASAGDRTQVVQSAVRHYSDWATPAPS
jgi:hypothetical protein